MPTSARLTCLTLAIVFATLTPACDEATPRHPFQTIVSTPGAGEKVPAAWRPAAIAALPDGSIAFTEQASRRVRILHPDGSLSTRFDHDPSQQRHPPLRERHWDDTWGLSLIHLREGALLVAGPKRPLLVIPQHDELPPLRIGAAPGQEPHDGLPLAEVDLSDLRGLTWHPQLNKLALAIGHCLWEASIDPALPLEVALNRAPLRHLAGTCQPGPTPRHGPATTSDLQLPDWTAMAYLPSGALFFIAPPQLRLLHGDRLLLIAGTGTWTGDAPLSLHNYSGRYLPQHGSAKWFANRIYFADGNRREAIRILRIESIDWEQGRAKGQISSALPYRVPSLDGFELLPDGTLVTSFAWAGAIMRLDSPQHDFVSLFGPLDPALRHGITQPEHHPYRLTSLLAPQALAPLGQGRVLIVNQPLARLIASVDRQQRPPRMAPFFASSDATGLPFTAMASDNERLLFFTERNDLVRIELASPQRPASATRMSQVFRRKDPSGVPGSGRDTFLPTPLTMASAHPKLLLHAPEEAAFYIWDPASAWLNIETSPRFGRSPAQPDATALPFFSLDLRELQAWDAFQDWRLVAVTSPASASTLLLVGNTSDDDSAFAHTTIQRRAYRTLVGGGDTPLAPGIPPAEVALNQVSAVALIARDHAAPTSFIFAVAEQDHIFHFDPNGELDIIGHACGPLPIAPTWIALAHDDLDRANALFIHAHDQSWACRLADQPLFLGQRLIEPTWTRLPHDTAAAQWLNPQAQLVTLEPGTANLRICRARLSGQADPRQCQDSDLPTAHSFAVSPEHVFIGTQDPQQGFIVYAGPFAPDPMPTQNLTLLPTIGGGSGFSSRGDLQSMQLGLTPSALAIDPTGDLLVTTLDTRALWRIEADDQRSIPTNPQVTLVHQGAPVFTGDGPYPLAVAADGQIATASNHQVWLIGADEVTRIAGIDPDHGEPGQALAPVRGLAWLERHLCVLTTDELFCLAPDGSRNELSRHGELPLPGQSNRSLHFHSIAQPPLAVGIPGELIIAIPEHHELLRIRPAL